MRPLWAEENNGSGSPFLGTRYPVQAGSQMLFSQGFSGVALGVYLWALTWRDLNENGDQRLASPGAENEDWWTRTQRIRTVAAVSLEVPILDVKEPPAYQRIASRAGHLHELGLSDRAIAYRLGVTGKTVAKGLRWLRKLEH